MNVEPCFSLVAQKLLLFVEMQKNKYQISLFFREHFFVKENDDFFWNIFNFRNEIFKLISLIGRHVLKLTSSIRVGYILELKRCWGGGGVFGTLFYICL
jgi:hypothetical protein